MTDAGEQLPLDHFDPDAMDDRGARLRAELDRLDHFDPDAMDDRGARLRAELDRLDMAKVAARTDALDAVRDAAAEVRTITARLDRTVAEARAYGATWQQIADATGLVKSAAWERWAHRG